MDSMEPAAHLKWYSQVPWTSIEFHGTRGSFEMVFHGTMTNRNFCHKKGQYQCCKAGVPWNFHNVKYFPEKC